LGELLHERLRRLVRVSILLLGMVKLSQQVQQVSGLPVGMHDIGREIAVQRVGNLVDVVTDAAKLGIQRRIERGRAGRNLDTAMADKLLAQPRHRQAGFSGIDGAA
jgi:hypothetical protein